MARMKRYLFIDGQLNGGGAERVLLDMLMNFDFSQNEVTLMQIVGGGFLLDELPQEIKRIEVWHGYELGYKLAYRTHLKLGWSIPLRHNILKVLHGQHFDVAISFLEGMPLMMHSLITEVADRNYSWVHCDLDKQRYTDSMFRKGEQVKAYSAMDAVICVAENTKEAFMRRFPNCTSSVKVIYNPIDVDKVIRLSGCQVIRLSEDDTFRIVVCGRLTEPKKLDRVIRLARRVKEERLAVSGERSEVRVQIIGDGELREKLMKFCELNGVEDMVEFLGFQRNPYPYIKAADMLLSTSGYEGFSLVVCEAMALGVPVVATKTAGPVEILDNDRYGLLCDHDDESIYQAVRRMYEDAELRRHYAAVGLECVKDFSVERTMSAIYEL